VLCDADSVRVCVAVLVSVPVFTAVSLGRTSAALSCAANFDDPSTSASTVLLGGLAVTFSIDLGIIGLGVSSTVELPSPRLITCPAPPEPPDAPGLPEPPDAEESSVTFTLCQDPSGWRTFIYCGSVGSSGFPAEDTEESFGTSTLCHDPSGCCTFIYCGSDGSSDRRPEPAPDRLPESPDVPALSEAPAAGESSLIFTLRQPLRSRTFMYFGSGGSFGSPPEPPSVRPLSPSRSATRPAPPEPPDVPGLSEPPAAEPSSFRPTSREVPSSEPRASTDRACRPADTPPKPASDRLSTPTPLPERTPFAVS